MTSSYTVNSKVFVKERQKYRMEERHFLFFSWEVKVAVDRPKKELIVFVQEHDDIDTVYIQSGEGDPIVVNLK